MMTSRRSRIKVTSYFVALAALLTLPGCMSILRRATMEKRPLSYVGQVSVGTPQVHKGRVVLPLNITGGRWLGDSGTALYRIQSRVSAHTIEMTVCIALAGQEPVPKELHLGRLPPGQYSLVYRDPDGTRHPLGRVQIPAAP